MKLIPGFSAWAIFAALLCFSPCALGQASIHNKATGAASHVLRYAPASFFVFTYAPASDHHRGCGDSERWSDKGGGGKCQPVPEGGSVLMYLLPAGLCCVGDIFLRFRQRAGV